jgi:hypothetical protein
MGQRLTSETRLQTFTISWMRVKGEIHVFDKGFGEFFDRVQLH